MKALFKYVYIISANVLFFKFRVKMKRGHRGTWIQGDQNSFTDNLLEQSPNICLFFCRSFTASGLMFKSLIHFLVNFYEKYQMGFQLYSSAWGYPAVPASFIKETVLSSLSILDSLANYQLTTYPRIYFWALDSVPLVCLSFFMPKPYWLDYDSFIV